MVQPVLMHSRKGINQESDSITWNNSIMQRISSTEEERINKTKKMVEIIRWTLQKEKENRVLYFPLRKLTTSINFRIWPLHRPKNS